jgi:uncharacterized Zn finger protein
MAKRRSNYNYDDFFPVSRPIKPADGIKAKNKRGAFGESWWGKRWIAVLNSFGIESRLQRGRSYARNGQVLNVDIEPGKVTAKVQGSMPKPYSVSIQLPLLTDVEWARVIEAMGAQAIFSAKLLSGEMPNEIEDAFNAANAPLFPKAGNQLQTKCSCPDYSNPCKHIAAVYYLIGEQFDSDPFLIFTLRGRTRDQIIEALRAQRSVLHEEAAIEDGVPLLEGSASNTLDADFNTFWTGGDISGFQPEITLPLVPLAMLKRLGNSPLDTVKDLSVAYQTVSEYAFRRATEDG